MKTKANDSTSSEKTKSATPSQSPPIAKGNKLIHNFLTAHGFTKTRDFIGNFNRGAVLYYKEMAPELFFVFCNNHFSLYKATEQFEFLVVKSDFGIDFLYTMLQQSPRSITRRFKLPNDKQLYEQELKKAISAK